MINRKHRFHGHGSLKYLFNKGRTIRNPLFGVRYVINNRRSNYRLAVIVSKKVNSSAVVRNRIRRRMFEFIRQNYVDSLTGVDIAVFIYDERVASVDKGVILDELDPIFAKISADIQAKS